MPGESKQRIEPRARKTFPRSGRLLRHSDFERVYKQGQRHFSTSMTVFFRARPESEGTAEGLRIGFTVGRPLGGAVQRNRIKRRIREGVRLTRPWPSANADVVINPKKGVLIANFDTLLNELQQAFVVIEKKLRGKEVAGRTESKSRKPEA